MKLSVIALDYDGTIASNGRADPDALASIVEAKSRGVVVILVTAGFYPTWNAFYPREDCSMPLWQRMERCSRSPAEERVLSRGAFAGVA